MKPFRIFRPGTHTASCGTKVEFTEDDLKRAVAAYSAALYAAPFVIGHPKTEDRAYGFAETLSYTDGHVVAHPDKVNPQFAEAVKSGAFRNRSASWYMPDHPNNPVPGVLYPKHIGFLGAAAPALKGLGDVEFSEAVEFKAEEHPELVVEFADAEDAWSLASMLSGVARMMRGLRDAMIADKGLEEADKQLPAWNIDDLERQALRQEEKARAAAEAMQPSYTEPTPPKGITAMNPEQIAALQAERDAANARLAQFTARETALAAAEQLAAVAGVRAQLEPHVKAGRILPAHAPALAAFVAGLPTGAEASTIEFGEPVEGVVPKVAPREFMLAFLGKLPKSVEYREVGGANGGNSTALTPKQLAAKAQELIDKTRKDTGRTMSYTEATNAVMSAEGVTVEEPGTAADV